MWLNNFSVRILGGKEHGGYIEIEHGKQYKIILRNNRYTPCDARVEVDGQHVGTFRIRDRKSITLERPIHDTGKFTFYKVGTQEAQQAQLQEGDPNLGLIKVTFTPGREQIATPLNPPWQFRHQQHYRWEKTPTPTFDGSAVRYSNLADNVSSHTVSHAVPSSAVPSAMTSSGPPEGSEAGGTGLSGESEQMFYSVTPLDYDYDQQTTIHLRLVAKSGNEPRPLVQRSTPVPPPVE
jgi:hypothetical protein